MITPFLFTKKMIYNHYVYISVEIILNAMTCNQPDQNPVMFYKVPHKE